MSGSRLAVSDLQREDQGGMSACISKCDAVQQAKTTDDQVKLVINMAEQAKGFQREMAKVFMQSFAPLCWLKDSFECSESAASPQPTKERETNSNWGSGHPLPISTKWLRSLVLQAKLCRSRLFVVG